MGIDSHGRLKLGHFDGGNYCVVVVHPDRANPAVSYFDHDATGSVYTFAPTLSGFLAKLRARPSGSG